MKVYINNEEVVCNRNLVINQKLSEPNSVILNNVYPKTWENDKDYVSRFYMPKDYSPVRIENENTDTKTYDLTNNTRLIENRAIEKGVIKYWKNCYLQYVRLIPGLTYTVTVQNFYSNTYSVCETDSLNIDNNVNTLAYIKYLETKTIQFTATKEYLITNHKMPNYNFITIKKISVSVRNNLIFSGIVKNSGNINLNPRYPHYSTLQAIDYSTLLSEGELLNYVLKDMTISEAITKLVTDQKGFMVGTIDIDNDEVLAPYNCNEKTTYDVLQYLSEITGAKWYTKAISKDLVLVNFYMPSRLPEADVIEYNQSYWQEKSIDDITYSYNANDYRNKQTIVNDETKASIEQTEVISYNGTDITTTYPVYNVTSIKSGTRTYSVASNVQKQAGISANFYYTYNSNKIDGGEIATGTILTIKYYPVVSARETSYNVDEINRISTATGRDGLISRYEKRTDTRNESALSQIAKTYLDYKGVPEIILKIQSHKDIFELGERTLFVGPLEDLKTRYLVKSKTINMIVTGTQQEIFYQYELSSSYNDETAINYFDNQRRKLEGNIAEGDYISRYVDLPSQTNIIFYGATFEPVEIDDLALDLDLEVEL